MSCSTCPDSAQPTSRSDGMASTQGQLLWSKDVGAWYRRQRERGERPAVATPALTEPPPPALAATAPFALPSRSSEAAAYIGEAIHELTGRTVTVAEARTGGGVFICPTDTDKQAALSDVGLGSGSVVLGQHEWMHFATRLQVLRVAKRMLPGFRVQAMDSLPLVQADELALYATDGCIVLAARNDHRLRYLRGDPRDQRIGVGYEDGLAPEDASKTLQRWRAGQADARYCPLCGAQISLDAKTCAGCAEGESLV